MSQPVHFSDGPGTVAHTSLSAVLVDTSGTVMAHGRAHKTWGLQVVVGGSGSPTGTVTLQLSLDGTNWSAAVATFTIGTTANKEIVWAADKPALYARAVLASLSGGTAPTVTARIVAV